MSASTSTSSPAKFAPVIQTLLVPAPGSIALSTDYSGLDIVVKSAARAAHSAAMGLGGIQNVHASTISNMASTVSRLLEARNLAEQLQELGVYTKHTSILTTTELTLLEPVTLAYNYFGSFHVAGKHYTARGLEDRLAAALIKLCAQTHYDQLNNENKVEMMGDDFADVDLDRYTIGDSGEVCYRDTTSSLRRRILDIINWISESGMDKDVCISLIRSATDLCDETSCLRFLSFLKTKGVSPGTFSDQNVLTTDHKAKAKTLLGQTTFADGTIIPSKIIISKITVAFSICRHITSLLSLRMKTCRVSQYQGGTAAQLATLEDSVLYSEQPLSLDDINMAVACSTSVGTAMRFRCCPPEERDNLVRQLVMQSMT